MWNAFGNTFGVLLAILIFSGMILGTKKFYDKVIKMLKSDGWKS